MYILDQIISVKGFEYIIAVVFIFVFILFYKFLTTDRTDEIE
jgi:hypothetical protein